MNTIILLVEQDRIGLREGVEGLQDGVEGLRAFCAVQQESLLWGFDELGLPRLEDARSARVLCLA